MTIRPIRIGFFLVTLAAGLLAASAPAQHGDFDLGNALVPVAQIHAGGPARGGIPSIDRPLRAGPRGSAQPTRPTQGQSGGSVGIPGRKMRCPRNEAMMAAADGMIRRCSASRRTSVV
jgi:hypothetical protein